MPVFGGGNIRDEAKKRHNTEIDTFLEVTPVLGIGSILLPGDLLVVLLLFRLGVERHGFLTAQLTPNLWIFFEMKNPYITVRLNSYLSLDIEIRIW